MVHLLMAAPRDSIILSRSRSATKRLNPYPKCMLLFSVPAGVAGNSLLVELRYRVQMTTTPGEARKLACE